MRAGAPCLRAWRVVGARAGDDQMQASQGRCPDGILPGRQSRHVGIQHRQGAALLAPALQVSQTAPARRQPTRGIQRTPVLPQQVVVRNQQDGNRFHKAFQLSFNVR
ncbi:hypothetical protein G6F22_020317 [Rhizopus arrhizus]|nr:hypothetical protein G6F22_020317 [Rhizopus arrhizus]